MDKRIKEIRIIKIEDSKEKYTFVTENILNNMKNKSVNNEKKSIKKSDDRIEKKIHSRKSRHKGRKVLGKSMQGHSPVYE